MLTQKEVENVLNSDVSVKDFCSSKGISRPTFYNYARRYGIDAKKNEIATNKIKSSVGSKFNRWLVIDFVGDTETSNGILSCRCDCGTVQNVRYYDLTSGQTKGCNACSTELRSQNCGKYERKLGKENWKFTGYEKISGQRWSQIKKNAIHRDISFEITIEYAYELLELQNFKCALSGVPIELPKGGKDERNFSASLDRIDSNIGYVNGNIQWVHKDINKMKQDYSESQFIQYCLNVANNYNGPINTFDEWTPTKKPSNFNGYKDIHGMYWRRVQINAEKRNIPFNITKEYIWDLYIGQGKKCKLSGLDIYFGYKDITASIDRIDSSIGYIERNIQIVHKHINCMKWEFTQKQFIEYCKLVTEKNIDNR